MTKVTKCTHSSSETSFGGRPSWPLVGERIQAARLQRGLAVDRVAEELGTSPAAYARYESGDSQVPALLLAQLAELLGVSMLCFFQDACVPGKDHEQVHGGSPSSSYRVATLEQRIGFLADTFSKLDLEGQQKLLAIAVSLSRTTRRRKAG